MFTSLLFVVLVAFLYAALLLMVRWAFASQGRTADDVRARLSGLRFSLAAWFILTASLAHWGVLRDFQSTPPRIFLVVGPALVIMLSLSIGPWFWAIYERFVPRIVVGLQSFRIVMEIILYLLYRDGLIPQILTFEGRNFDIVVGLSAPLVTRTLMKPGTENWRLVLAWNIAGLFVLTNVVICGILSAPTPFQVFYTDPPNTLLAEFPYIWLPTFVVPFAYFLHIVSIRQCVQGLRRRPDAPL